MYIYIYMYIYDLYIHHFSAMCTELGDGLDSNSPNPSMNNKLCWFILKQGNHVNPYPNWFV